ncbi:MAG: PAS domain-containing protein, partial [Bacteroidota bacterium]|nr:PAS domain-containing protein [Bacteroidota bacterium]
MNQTTTELSPGYLINNFPDVVTIIDKSGKIIFVNPSAHTIFKIDSQLLTNKNAIDFIHFGDRNNILKLVNENIKKGKRNFNIQFRARFNKNQKWKWIESNGNIVFEKEIHFILNSLEIIKVKKSLSELDLHKNALMHTV